MAAHSGRVLDPPLLMPAKMMRGGAQRAILIGSSAIKNLRIRLKPLAMFFSESRYSAIHPENRQCRPAYRRQVRRGPLRRRDSQAAKKSVREREPSRLAGHI